MTHLSKYFDLHITGIGYLSRIRSVPVRRGQPFLAVDISALHGAADQVEYTRFDCKVSGEDAKGIVASLEQAVRENSTVLIGFKLGDLYAETFTYDKGEKAGQTGVSLKARLLYVAWVKIDGKDFYRAPLKQEEIPAQDCQSNHDGGWIPTSEAA
ncbi:STY4534 family ICE replication protein [Methyloterricola oryzae]|uniref:STY4534 family ICE replication protein n=1 Tax=Methyloterricola oryzae TaxID=1495050 RepID=UPI0005EBB3FC|nr:STY4534 family ICE replication protein [Methyloterricola oryzae]